MGMGELGITILPVGSPLEQRLEKSGNYTARRDDLIQMAAGRSIWVLGMWALHRDGVQRNTRIVTRDAEATLPFERTYH